VVLAGICHGMI